MQVNDMLLCNEDLTEGLLKVNREEQ